MGEALVHKPLRDADGEFRRNQRLHRRRMRCRQGCDACCHRFFSITEPEAAEVSRAVSELPPERADALRRNARSYVEQRLQIFRQVGYVESWGALPAENTRLACPALEKGSCQIYDARPRSCRLYGAPLVHIEQPGRVFACELNFPPGATIEDERLTAVQGDLGEDWRRLQADFDHLGGQRYDEPVTVAHAILEDFRGRLPR